MTEMLVLRGPEHGVKQEVVPPLTVDENRLARKIATAEKRVEAFDRRTRMQVIEVEQRREKIRPKHVRQIDKLKEQCNHRVRQNIVIVNTASGDRHEKQECFICRRVLSDG